MRYSSDLNDSSGQYILELHPSTVHSDDVPGEISREEAEGNESCCHLEVVRQGQYLGLRSASAGFRFLQPRRKFPHRLVFFNSKLGVWEQWEVVGEELDGGRPWSRAPLRLRSRRLPHVELQFDAIRVGSYSSHSPEHAAPRRGSLYAVSEAPIPPNEDQHQLRLGGTGDVREDVQLMRINGLFAQEWTRCGY